MSNGSQSSDDELAALLEAEYATHDAEPEPQPNADQPLDSTQPPKRRKLEQGKPDKESICPPHPGYMGGICIRCGVQKPTDTTDEDPGLALKYIHHGLEVSRHEAGRLKAFASTHALNSKRLLLVLDLDHTLLNSTRITDLTPEVQAKLMAQLEAQPKDEYPLLYCIPHMRMWTKLRPGIRNFLLEAQKLFELHVYTMGDNDYAGGMANILDPDGKLFAGRVASARDAGGSGFKDVDVLLGDEDLVLIMDDTAAVWPRHRANLLQVDRYIYFPACAQKFGYPGISLIEKDTDESVETGTFSTCLRVLTEVHRRFFESSDDDTKQDVRGHLAAIKKEILSGVKILFSRVIPLDCADPSTHPVWRLAEEMGAQCVKTQDPDVTHVVANDVTDKTRWGLSVGAHVVSLEWLWSCAFKWERVDESKFPLVARDAGGANKPLPRVMSERAQLKAAIAAAGGGHDSPFE